MKATAICRYEQLWNYDQNISSICSRVERCIEKRDIEQERKYLEMRAKALTEGYFAIYQARENEDVQFMDFASISEQHMDVTEFNYNLKYADVLGIMYQIHLKCLRESIPDLMLNVLLISMDIVYL